MRQPLDDAQRLSIGSVEMLSPVGNPGKLIAAPVNYRARLAEAIANKSIFSRAHVQEIKKTGLFFKGDECAGGASGPICITHLHRRTDHEIELAVIISGGGQFCPPGRRRGSPAGSLITPSKGA